ncbi:hypothetical protein BKA65DRAFT_126317 [Rhexocercosporidium sp. MPI-PUGE-AT-0058]|nr:hypothetical protein BKA65DRAFT_126317 [Rhexocercosporidium sp. MPI-PUGE-AT-0058]
MSNPLESLTGAWSPAFATSSDPNYETENTPYIKAKEEAEGSLIGFFMRQREETNRHLYPIEDVEGLCNKAEASLGALQAVTNAKARQPVAWLDEWSNVDETGRRRVCRGPLTALRLYQELLRERFYPIADIDLADKQTSGTGVAGEESEPDADRRIIYIQDLDAWTIHSLVGTVPARQALVLRDALHRHVAFKPAVEATVNPHGHRSTFALAFHMPFFAWRKDNSLRLDHRRRADGQPLRRSQNLSFLRQEVEDSFTTAEPTMECLHEAQISCIVTGSSNYRWVAYFFNEIFFEDDENRESVEALEQERQQEEGLPCLDRDPLPADDCPAAPPIRDPRRYFLRVFKSRMGRVMHEWREVVSRLEGIVGEYTDDYAFSLSHCTSPSDTGGKQERSKRKSEEWTTKTTTLLTKLLLVLSRTVDAWDAFKKGDIGCFSEYGPPETKPPPGCSECLREINKSFESLRTHQKTLEHLREQLRQDLARFIQLQLLQEGREVAQRQHMAAEHASMVNNLFYPVVLAAAMFSMQEKVIFLTQSPASFLMSVIVIAVLMWAARTAPLHRARLCERFAALVQPKSVAVETTNPVEGVLGSFDRIMRIIGRAPRRRRGGIELSTIDPA